MLGNRVSTLVVTGYVVRDLRIIFKSMVFKLPIYIYSFAPKHKNSVGQSYAYIIIQNDFLVIINPI